ncbi:MAG TPA: glycosyltransferase family 4 protein [Elainellaceae cyanobacterium]
MDKPRVVWLLTHRIQYFTNLLEELHHRGNVEVKAIYAHETANFQDKGFGRKISWDNRHTTSFPNDVLHDSAERPHGPLLNSRSRYLDKALNDFKPHVVHLNGYTTAIQLQGWWWAIRHQVPYLIRCDGDNIGKKTGWKSTIRRQIVRPITGNASKVMYQGRQNREFWESNGANDHQLVWVPCVSDSQVFRVTAFETDASRQRFRADIGAAAHETVFVMSGKLEPRKRPSDAIRALARLTDLPIKLWFLGSGQLEAELKTLSQQLGVDDQITWLGFRNQSQIPAILQAADVLLHASQMDPWPYAILDGAISGTALLLSDRTGSYPDWMADPPAGLVFECGNVEHLAQCMTAMATDSAQLMSYRDAAKTRAADYTESTFCNIFEQAVFECLRV